MIREDLPTDTDGEYVELQSVFEEDLKTSLALNIGLYLKFYFISGYDAVCNSIER
jgi:hypothetical protein